MLIEEVQRVCCEKSPSCPCSRGRSFSVSPSPLKRGCFPLDAESVHGSLLSFLLLLYLPLYSDFSQGSLV